MGKELNITKTLAGTVLFSFGKKVWVIETNLRDGIA